MERVVRKYSRRPSGPCALCGTQRQSLHRDHIIPLCKGGPDTPDNIQFICANCHEDKTREDMRGFKIKSRGNGMRGRKHSAETKAKISAANKGNQFCLGRVLSAESRAKMSAARKRRITKDETRAKLAVAVKASWARRRSLLEAAATANHETAAVTVH